MWWLRQSGGTGLVLRLANGTTVAAPWFEGSADMVVSQTPVILDDCRAQAKWPNRCKLVTCRQVVGGQSLRV